MKIFKYSLVASALLALGSTAKADDTELYVNNNVNPDEKPRVIIVFDTSGSMARASGESSRMEIAQNAINGLIDANPDIDFGLMRFRGSTGGYVLKGLGTDHDDLKTAVNGLSPSGNTPLAETVYEGMRYLTGGWLDQANHIDTLSLRDTSVDHYDWGRARYYYSSPFVQPSDAPLRCDNSINMILMTDGEPTHDTHSNSKIVDRYEDKFGDTPGTVRGSYLPALAKTLYGVPKDPSRPEIEEVAIDLYPATPSVKDVGRVYTIGFGTGMSDTGKEILDATAKAGGGQFIHANTAEDLVDALNVTINTIREVSDTFVAPAVSSNSYDRTRTRDSLYYAMFYPSEGARWVGNLKKLKVVGDNIVDKNGNPAVHDSTGAIKSGAQTYWLPDGEAADGGAVPQGGANLAIANASNRKIFSDINGFSRFTVNKVKDAFGEDNAPAKFGLADFDDVKKTIHWSKGIDVDDANGDGDKTDTRADIMGDLLHTKPVAIDYGTQGVHVLVGTNAGYVHMFKDAGNTISETWAFIPQKLFPIIKPLRDDAKGKKVYGMDGPISIHFDDANGNGTVDTGDKVWAFFAMRRGGSSYYAMDITNPNNPSLKWSITADSGDFKELGQSWSKAQVIYAKISGHDSAKPLLVFGAGYDTNKDSSSGDDSKGRGIFIVDAETGKKVWSLTPDSNGFSGKHSIAADIATLDSDNDGYVDRLYASDTGGNIWRVDMPEADTSKWSHFKFAALGGTGTANDRRFFYKPMVASTYFSKVTNVTTTEVDGNSTTQVTRQTTPYDAILIGSGNRPTPTSTTVSDQLFMLRDENVITQTFTTGNPAPATITQTELKDITSDPFAAKLDDAAGFYNLEKDLSTNFKGWYYQLSASEKSLSPATVVGGVAYFTTFTPQAKDPSIAQCSLGGGEGALYAFHLHYGTKVYAQLKQKVGESIPDTPTMIVPDGDGIRLLTPKPTKPKSINPLPPKDEDGDGKIDLVKSGTGINLKTHQTYIYKLEDE